MTMEEGEIVPAVSGIVEEVYKQRSGEKNGKPWAFQDLVIKDGSVRIGVSISERKEIPASVKGKLLTFISSSGSRGLTGVKIILDTYKGETRKKLRVTPTAEIVEGSGQWEDQRGNEQPPQTQEEFDRQKAARRAAPPQNQRQSENRPLSREFDGDSGGDDGGGDDGDLGPKTAPPQQTAQQPSEPGPWFNAPKDWRKYDSAAAKHYRIMQRTLTMTNAIAAWSDQRGIVVTPEHFQAMQAQLFIEACRSGLKDLVPNCDPPEPKG